MEAICNIAVELPTAPDLILDMLVVNGRVLSAQALCRAGGLMGISDATMRLGLTRLASQRKITHSARGVYAFNCSGPALARDIDAWRRKGSQTVAWRRHALALQLRLGAVPAGPAVAAR